MIIVCIGTRAQLIKTAPVMLEMEKRSVPYKLIMTGQHKQTIKELLLEFNIKQTPEFIYEGNEITGVLSMFFWAVRCISHVFFNKKKYKDIFNTNRNIIVVHGDTISTLVGAVIGKLSGNSVAHIESGLRSYNLFNPFPEEITRILTFRLTDIAFCAGDWAIKNMENYKLHRVNTNQNTLLDSIRHIIGSTLNSENSTLSENYCVCSIHRFENIFFKNKLERIVNLIEYTATIYPVVFILHPATEKNLIKFNLIERLTNNTSIKLKPRTGYSDFIHLIYKSKFVITDGGSNQEELTYLGKPVLLMRKVTERQEGLNLNVIICNYKKSILNDFIENLTSYSVAYESDRSISPSSIIVDELLKYQT